MRRIVRQPLSSIAEKRLADYQRRVDQGEPVQIVWERARRTKAMETEVAGTLRRMAGPRERCFFCEDSHGTDVEHFWPKTPYPERAVRGYLQEVARNDVGAEARETLLAAVMDNDDYGISCWFFHRDGAEKSPFAELRNRFPEIWEAARALVSQ